MNRHDAVPSAISAIIPTAAWVCNGSFRLHRHKLLLKHEEHWAVDSFDERNMNIDDFVFLGTKGRVTAVRKSDGKTTWEIQLPGHLQNSFVTLTCDDHRLYAHTRGQLHCLDWTSGKLLWTNQLEGLGYQIASICLHGHPTAPAPEMVDKIQDDARRNSD